jgi:hypothetical protein
MFGAYCYPLLSDLTEHFDRTDWKYTSGSCNPGQCGHCGQHHVTGGMCPRIKAIEYHENGMVKRVEYHP